MPLHVRDLGSGPPVVFLHPGPGLDGSVFLPHATRVADAGFRVLLADLPGSGRSPADRLDARRPGRGRSRTWPTSSASRTGRCSATRSAATSRCSTWSTTARAARYVASCTDAEEEEPPGVSDDRSGRHARGGRQAAFEREASVATAEECREVWRRPAAVLRQRPGAVEPMLDKVVFQPEAHHEHDWGELHALGALAAFGGPVLAIAGDRRPGAAAARTPSGSPAPRAAASCWSSTARGTSRSPRRPSATGRR